MGLAYQLQRMGLAFQMQSKMPAHLWEAVIVTWEKPVVTGITLFPITSRALSMIPLVRAWRSHIFQGLLLKFPLKMPWWDLIAQGLPSHVWWGRYSPFGVSRSLVLQLSVRWSSQSCRLYEKYTSSPHGRQDAYPAVVPAPCFRCARLWCESIDLRCIRENFLMTRCLKLPATCGGDWKEGLSRC